MSAKKVSKAFRERIVPNVQADPQIKLNDQNVFLCHNLHETKLLNLTNTMHNNFLKERYSNLIRTSKNVAKFNNKTLQKPVIPAQIQKNNQPKRLGSRYLKQSQQQINQQFFRNSTDQSQKIQPNKLNRIQQIVKTKRTTKSEIVNKILKQIEERINLSQQSLQSLPNKYKDRKKKRVEDCKVVKIPWKNSKEVQFCPEFSMIRKNMSIGPRESLKQIYDNLK